VGGPGICITLGFVIFMSSERERLLEAIKARRQ